jgi:hypothetical protein
MYVTRWCQITENKFRYYKNQITAYQNPGKPLVSVPLADIMHINKTVVGKNEVQFEVQMSRDLSEYI